MGKNDGTAQANGLGNGIAPDVELNGVLDPATQMTPSDSFCERMSSWRARTALNMHFVMILFVMLRLNMPIAMVCMIETAPSAAPTSTHNASSLKDVTSLSSASVAALNGSSFPGVTSMPVSAAFTASSASWTTDAANTTTTTASSVLNVSSSGREFHWESSTQGLILTSANMLGFVMPLLTDSLSRLVGGKRLLLVGMSLSGVLTILHPVGARASPYVLIALRIMLGLVGGMSLPIITEVFSWWAPSDEKVSMVSFAFAGINIGNILVGATSGFLCSIPVDNGWPFIFYVQGALCLLWCVQWQLFGTVRPEDHPFISEDEKLYILRTRIGMAVDTSKKRASPPYKAILTSAPVWGFVVLMMFHGLSTMIVFTYLPLFLSTVYGFSISEVGLYASLGFVMRFTGTFLWSMLSNLLTARTRHGTTVIRKLIQCSGFLMSAVGLATLGFMKGAVGALVVLFIVFVAQSATMASGIIVPLDIAPRYAGILTGMSITLSTLLGIPGPILVSMMTEQGTQEEWRNVFLVVASLFGAGGTIFLIFGSAKLQSWAVPAGSSESDEKTANAMASDFMTRRMTVLSMGPPMSPSGNKSFEFNFRGKANFIGAQYRHGGSSPPANVVANDNDNNNKNKSNNNNNNNKNNSNNNNTAKPNTKTQESSYSNPGFEPETSSNADTSCKTTASTGPQRDQTKDRTSKSRPGLKLDVSRTHNVSFQPPTLDQETAHDVNEYGSSDVRAKNDDVRAKHDDDRAKNDDVKKDNELETPRLNTVVEQTRL